MQYNIDRSLFHMKIRRNNMVTSIIVIIIFNDAG